MHISVFIARFWISNYLGMLCCILSWVKRDKRGEDMPQVFGQSHWIVCVRMCAAPWRKKNLNEIGESDRYFLRKNQDIFLVHWTRINMVNMDNAINTDFEPWYHSLCLFWYYILHSFIPSHSYSTSFIRRHSPRFLSISSSLVSGQLSGKNLPGVPSLESNLGLAYSKSTNYQLKRGCKFVNRRLHLVAVCASVSCFSLSALTYCLPHITNA